MPRSIEHIGSQEDQISQEIDTLEEHLSSLHQQIEVVNEQGRDIYNEYEKASKALKEVSDNASQDILEKLTLTANDFAIKYNQKQNESARLGNLINTANLQLARLRSKESDLHTKKLNNESAKKKGQPKKNTSHEQVPEESARKTSPNSSKPHRQIDDYSNEQSLGRSEKYKKPQFEILSIKTLKQYIRGYRKEIEREKELLTREKSAREKTSLSKSISELESELEAIQAILQKKIDAEKNKKDTKQKDTVAPPEARQDTDRDIELEESESNSPTNMTTATEKGEQMTQEGFSIGRALNTKGFAEYAVHFDMTEEDLADESNEKIKKLYESFMQSEQTKADLSAVFQSEIKKDLGIDLEKTELDAIAAYVETKRLSDPQEIITIGGQIEKFKQNKKAVSEKEQQIKEAEQALAKAVQDIGGEEGIQRLKEEAAKMHEEWVNHLARAKKLENGTTMSERRDLARTHGKYTWWNPYHWVGVIDPDVIKTEIKKAQDKAKEAEDAIKNTQGKYTSIEDARRQLEGLKTTRAIINEAHAIIKRSIFDGVDESVHLRDMLQKKMVEKISSLIHPKNQKEASLRNAEIAQKTLQKLQSAETLIGDTSSIDVAEIQNQIDAAIETEFNKEVESVLKGFKTGDSNAYSNLEKSLKPFFTKERTSKLGSKEGQEAQQFILDTLEAKRQDVWGRGDKAKALLLSFIIRNLKQGAIK